MVQNDRRSAHLRLFELLLCAILGALAFALKMAMAALPNIHPVALLLLLCALSFGWRSLVTCGIYVLLEGLIFGFSTWWYPYLVAWPLLILVAVLCRRRQNRFFWATLAALHGFLFGFFFLPINYFVYNMAENPGMVTLYILNDLPFSVIHGISNFVIVLVLLPPLKRAMEKILSRVK